MNKTAMKLKARTCSITGEILPLDPSLIDVDRLIEKHKGGIYTKDNVRVLTPRAHMERHGILRERDEWLEEMKSIMDDRSQTMKLVMKINNQILAYARNVDHQRESTSDFLNETMDAVKKRLDKVDREVAKHLKKSPDPLVHAALGVVGVGPVTVAGLIAYVDLEKANSASSLWSYVGLHKASRERYTKGEAGGGNKTLRTMLWNMVNSMMKNKGCPYRIVYDRTKTRLEASEKMVMTRNTQGKEVESMWKDTKPSHRHGAALRAMMKHFLADYWFVGRELAGLDTRPLYVQDQLGHTGIVNPKERGWIW
jgi:hypothetical protein